MQHRDARIRTRRSPHARREPQRRRGPRAPATWPDSLRRLYCRRRSVLFVSRSSPHLEGTPGSLSLAIYAWVTGFAAGRMARLASERRKTADFFVSTDPIRRVSPDGGLPSQSSVLEQINDAVIAVDTAERVTYLNRAATRLYGVSRERAVGQPLQLIAGYRFYDST